LISKFFPKKIGNIFPKIGNIFSEKPTTAWLEEVMLKELREAKFWGKDGKDGPASVKMGAWIFERFGGAVLSQCLIASVE
jgi:hypothetical protein